jgi:predicted aldo/keto reductase-like oxidoreductase
VLQTKLRPHANPGEFGKQLEESFALLGVDTIDLLSFHGRNTSPKLRRADLARGRLLEVADQFAAPGGIRHLGFSTHAALRLLVDTIRSDRF